MFYVILSDIRRVILLITWNKINQHFYPKVFDKIRFELNVDVSITGCQMVYTCV